MMKNYETEVCERWGDTDAYHEYTEKMKHNTKEKQNTVNEGLMAVFAEFAACRNSGVGADSEEAQMLAAKLRTYITEHYYTCTDEILAGLGKIYGVDERFKKNIDKYGKGTAEFAAEAIAAYTAK